MPEDEKLSETIRELYAIVNQLERDYNKHDRRFTLDGHLLGSIGEVYAAERYGIELAKSSSERHDGTTTDERKRDVQIKVTPKTLYRAQLRARVPARPENRRKRLVQRSVQWPRQYCLGASQKQETSKERPVSDLAEQATHVERQYRPR